MAKLAMPQPGQPLLGGGGEDLGSFGSGKPMRCPYRHRPLIGQILDPQNHSFWWGRSERLPIPSPLKPSA
jgi:hypothetical protein